MDCHRDDLCYALGYPCCDACEMNRRGTFPGPDIHFSVNSEVAWRRKGGDALPYLWTVGESEIRGPGDPQQRCCDFDEFKLDPGI
jgi:hypothetical protein